MATEEKKESQKATLERATERNIFIEHYAQTLSVKSAAEAVGLSYQGANQFIQRHPELREAMNLAEAHLNNKLASRIYKLANSSKDIMAIMKVLSKRLPDEWSDKPKQVNHSHTIDLIKLAEEHEKAITGKNKVVDVKSETESPPAINYRED